VKLLRLLQQGEYYAVGCDILRKVNTHIVVATNEDLAARMAAGKFRKDLFYRLCTHHIHVPPLRERPEDLIPLCAHFLSSAARDFGRDGVAGLTPEVLAYFTTYSFPGNVRELRSMLFDATARFPGTRLSLDSFPSIAFLQQDLSVPAPLRKPGSAHSLVALFGRFPTARQVMDYLVQEALRLTNGNQVAAASLLDISRPTLNKRLKRQPPQM
jgi:DNA-binding NtrC family response regulator